MLLNKDTAVNAQGGHYGNALQAASYQCRKEVVELLLNKGADISVQSGLFGNGLRPLRH
jgi:ankyrin repeat protein